MRLNASCSIKIVTIVFLHKLSIFYNRVGNTYRIKESLVSIQSVKLRHLILYENVIKVDKLSLKCCWSTKHTMKYLTPRPTPNRSRGAGIRRQHLFSVLESVTVLSTNEFFVSLDDYCSHWPEKGKRTELNMHARNVKWF